MKRLFCVIFAMMLLLCGCSNYLSPDVAELMNELIETQSLDNMTIADDRAVEILYGVDLSQVESYAASYSGKGGYADMIAIFKLVDDADPQAVSELLTTYKENRYEDFKGYAPFEAEKVENGRVLVYGQYALLLILPDIAAGLETVDKAFKG